MPLPIIIGIGAAIAGAVGVGGAVKGGIKMKDANDTMKTAEARHQRNLDRFDEEQKKTTKKMDLLGKFELEILGSFKLFQDYIELIQNRPKFKEYRNGDCLIPRYDKEELKKASIGATVLLGGLSSAGVGTAAAIAAGGTTTAAVMALGTASTGTAIATLSGAAATNATLAALGGGALAAGGGGMALGSAILGGATLGVGLLVGGIIFNFTGSALSQKADEAWNQMKKAEVQINNVCDRLRPIHDEAEKYMHILKKVYFLYQEHLKQFASVIVANQVNSKKVDWNKLSQSKKSIVENTSMLVSLLFGMCKIEFTKKIVNSDERELNVPEIKKREREAITILKDKFSA